MTRRKLIDNQTDLSKLRNADLSEAINVETDPSRAQHHAYSAAFDYFNDRLFGNKLPRCLLNFSRKSNAYGFFAPDRWERWQGKTSEISLNPDLLKRPAVEIISTLVHEMCHLWQHIHGTPSRSGYHNQEWADQMLCVGLQPVAIDNPGKVTGQKVSHTIIDDGPFARYFAAMPADYLFPWVSSVATKDKPKSKNQNKVKYTCEGCELQVWGKADLNVICGECGLPLQMEVKEEN